jgi:hypothetical protein
MRKALGLVFVVMLFAVPVLAAAQVQGPPEGAMLIILDASGSMNNLDENGVPFIDKAKDAVLELVDALPDGMNVGLRVYGHREPNTDAVRGCQDTELVAPVAPLDRTAIRDALEGIEASGFTPIGLSLQEAVTDLPETGTRSIVLISDGEDTCAPPDPCEVAEDLYGDLFDVRIESVGFLIDPGSAAEQQLRCIAEVTGGQYTAVGEASELVARLGEVTESLLDWRPPMTLNGSLDPLAAPEFPLSPKADWATDEPGKIAVGRYGGILMPGEIRWYQLDLWEAESFWIWGDLEWPPDLEAGGAFETIILDSNGNQVEVPVGHSDVPLRSDLSSAEPHTTGATVEVLDRGWPVAATYLVGFHWDAEPDVFLGSSSVTVEVLDGDARRYLARTSIDGTLDPAEAPELPLAGSAENGPEWRGGEFRGSLASGETRWYRLDLERGEVMNVLATFPGDRFVGEGTEGEFSIVLTDLNGEPVGSAFDSSSHMDETFGDERHQATVSGTTSFNDDPLSETVMIGFQWAGSQGQESEIRFEVEAMLDPHRKEMADQIEMDTADEGEQGTVSVPLSSAASTSTTGVDSTSDSGLFPVAILLVVGGVAIGAAVAAFLARRSRSG